jgi:VWFA-related protein
MRFAERRTTLISVLLGGAILLAAVAPLHRASAQNPASPEGQPQQQGKIQVNVSLVNMFATVRDNHHAIVGDLTKDDFKIFEDDQLQQLSFFGKEVTMPITLGLMVDTSGSQQNLLGLEQVAATRFFQKVMRKGDEAMVLDFDTDVNLLADFTEDLDALDRAVERTQINSPIGMGPMSRDNVRSTAMYDAIYVACNEQLSGQAGRKALILMTDAMDEGSKVGIKDAIEAAQRADTVVHFILIAEPGAYGMLGYNGGSVAKKIAEETGGRVIDANGGKRLDEAFDQISEELRSQYVLGYYPTNPAHDGTFRKIRVETTKTGLKVLARHGYYAPKR